MSTIEEAMNKYKKTGFENIDEQSGDLEIAKKDKEENVTDQDLDQAADLQRIASEYEDELNPQEFWHGNANQDTSTVEESKSKNEPVGVKVSQTNESGLSEVMASDGIFELNFKVLKEKNIIVPGENNDCLVEEFRGIKRPILNNAFGPVSQEVNNSNIVMVSSALPGEGKTFTSLNLAMSMATEMDTTVLLIDADIPRPSVSELIGLDPNLPGLIDMLLDDKVQMSDVLVKTNIENLAILPAGRGHANATEIMASTAMSSLMTEVSKRYSDRVVILDSPPLLITSEAKVLAEKVGQVVMVVESNLTSHEQVKQAMEMLDDNDIVNLVLNKSRYKTTQPYYGSYSRYKKIIG